MGKKTAHSLEKGLNVIVCIGETLDQRYRNQIFDVLDAQLTPIASEWREGGRAHLWVCGVCAFAHTVCSYVLCYAHRQRVGVEGGAIYGCRLLTTSSHVVCSRPSPMRPTYGHAWVHKCYAHAHRQGGRVRGCSVEWREGPFMGVGFDHVLMWCAHAHRQAIKKKKRPRWRGL